MCVITANRQQRSSSSSSAISNAAAAGGDATSWLFTEMIMSNCVTLNSVGRKPSLASLAFATFELLYESASIDVCERVLPPVRVVVDRG